MHPSLRCWLDMREMRLTQVTQINLTITTTSCENDNSKVESRACVPWYKIDGAHVLFLSAVLPTQQLTLENLRGT